MKNPILYVLVLIVFSCKKKQTPVHPLPIKQTTTTTIVPQKTKPKVVNNNSLLGYYVGDFIATNGYSNSNKITISIDKIKSDSIYGHSIVAGNNRPFKGLLNTTHLKALVKEPGDDPYDGTFNITLMPELQTVTGYWESNNTKLKANKRTFSLEKRAFRYDKDIALFEDLGLMELYNEELNKDNTESIDFTYEFLTQDVLNVNPSNTLLTEENLSNMPKGDLEVLRNSIFARHGYSFKTKKMRFIFDDIDWYMPVFTDVRHQLTSIEKSNINLIKRFEQHAERYYDSFGR